MNYTNKHLIHIDKTDAWRNTFHIQPPTGLLNDPNGLIYHDGLYHVFYQWHPDAPIHGLKYWNHVTSKDLVHWSQDTRILAPDTEFDSHGAYSGSAIVYQNQIELIYTGNTRDSADVRFPFQIKASLTKSGIEDKKVVISEVPQGYTDHFRDPKVFETETGYTMILGAQRNDLTGTVVSYSSSDLTTWTFDGELKTSLRDFGYMWECPDLFRVNGTDIFLFCPQGAMNTPIDNTNVYPNAYVLGSYDASASTLCNHTQPKLIDHGFDFYASQTFTDSENRRILIAWIGSVEEDNPTHQYGWDHVLSIPRVLTIEDNRLYQNPHPNMVLLRKGEVSIDTALDSYELSVLGIEGDFDSDLFTNGLESISLRFDAKSQTLVLDRSNISNRISINRGDTRTIKLEEPLSDIRLLRDTSTIELFINSGKYTMTLRFFPDNTKGHVKINNASQTIETTYYALEDVNYDL